MNWSTSPVSTAAASPPCSIDDKEGVDQFVNLMKDLRSENKTVIVASQDEIPGLVYDRRLRMKDGILLAEE